MTDPYEAAEAAHAHAVREYGAADAAQFLQRIDFTPSDLRFDAAFDS